MYDCPHCGEPLEDDAPFCHHCGSDEETGWNPEVDYYAVEIPEDDFPPSERSPDKGERSPFARRTVTVVLISSLLVFMGAASAFRWEAIAIAGVLVSAVLLGWWMSRRSAHT